MNGFGQTIALPNGAHQVIYFLKWLNENEGRMYEGFTPMPSGLSLPELYFVAERIQRFKNFHLQAQSMCVEKYSHPETKEPRKIGVCEVCGDFAPVLVGGPMGVFCEKHREEVLTAHMPGDAKSYIGSRCECGAAKLKLPGHSDWCPAKEKE